MESKVHRPTRAQASVNLNVSVHFSQSVSLPFCACVCNIRCERVSPRRSCRSGFVVR